MANETVVEIGNYESRMFELHGINRKEYDDVRHYYRPAGFENELIGIQIVCRGGLTLTEVMGKRVEAKIGQGKYVVGSTNYPRTKLTIYRVTEAPATDTLNNILRRAPRRIVGRNQGHRGAKEQRREHNPRTQAGDD